MHDIMPTPSDDIGFYVTVQRQLAQGVKYGWLLGPFATKEQAESMVWRGKTLAHKVDPRTAFDAFGVSSRTPAIGAGLLNGMLNDPI